MNVPRSLVVLGAAGVLAAAGTVAVNATTTDPRITLCIQSTTGVVIAAGDHGCPSATKPVRVPTTDAVDALDARLSALEPHLSYSIGPSSIGEDYRHVQITGRNLEPHADVVMHTTIGPSSDPADAYGQLVFDFPDVPCRWLPAPVEATGENGEHLTTTIPAC